MPHADALAISEEWMPFPPAATLADPPEGPTEAPVVIQAAADPAARPARPPKPPMEERIKAERETNPLCHDWIVAAEVPVDTKTAKHADLRQSFRAHDGLRIDALEVYCRKCRRPLDEVGDQTCAAKVDNTHLIGGDQSVRAKRKIPQPQGRIVKAPVIQRRGMDAYLKGYGKS